MESEDLQMDPCRLSDPLNMSALHLAALQGHGGLLTWLQEVFPGAVDAMHSLKGGADNLSKTPAELYELSGAHLSTTVIPETEPVSHQSQLAMEASESSIWLGLRWIWERLPWTFILFFPIAILHGKTQSDTLLAFVLALVADLLSVYGRYRRQRYLHGMIESHTDGSDTAGAMGQFERHQNPVRRLTWSKLGSGLACYWSLTPITCLSALTKCTPEARPFWLAWLAGSFLFSMLLLWASTHMTTIRSQKLFNMVAVLAIAGLVNVMVGTQPDEVNPTFPPPDEVTSIAQSMAICVVMGGVVGAWYSRAFGPAPLHTTAFTTILDVATLGVQFRDVHFGKLMPFSSWMLLGLARQVMCHWNWIQMEGQRLESFLRSHAKKNL
eukprot:scaffold144644_cov43-Prasinocladus_malaysianus.AAC.1